MKIIEKISNFFNRIIEKDIVLEETSIKVEHKTREELMGLIDLDKVEDIEFIDNNQEKNLLILDDQEVSFELYKADFRKIERGYNVNPLNDFNIINVLGVQAGLMAYKYIINNENKIDYAMLDITLGFIIKLDNGEHFEFDGIDIAILLIKYNPNIKFLFLTAHTLNRRNPVLSNYFEKFEESTGKSIEDFYLNKNVDRFNKLYELLYGVDS